MSIEGTEPGLGGDARWLAIVNPAAGGGRAAARWPALARALEARGVAFDTCETRGPGDAIVRARAAHAAGIRRFIAIGGDGTLHEVANGLLSATFDVDTRGAPAPRAAQHPATTDARAVLAAAPLGTGNDWARALRLPSDASELAGVIAAGRTRRVDAALVEYDDGGTRRTRYVVNVAGAGYDAWVVERLPSGGPRGLAYLLALVRGLWRYDAPRFRFTGDGGAFDCDAPLFAAFVAIGPYCGGGMRFAPAADLADGELDLVAVPHVGPWGALRRLRRVFNGTLPRDPLVRYGRAAAALIDATPPARVEADGQLLGYTPARITVLPGAIDALVAATGGAR